VKFKLKFNVKIELKTKAKTLILIFLLALSTTAIVNIKGKVPESHKEVEEINTSSSITPQYKYHYENDFDYFWFTIEPAILAGFAGSDTEWSQDPNDVMSLQLAYYNIFQSDQFSMSGTLFVESHNTFKKQNNNLGAYIDWHIDIDVILEYALDVDSIEITLAIIGPIGEKELISIYDPDLSSQEGRFYIPNFDQYIWSGSGTEGKIYFKLTGDVHGEVLESGGGINLLLSFEGLRVVQEIMPKEQVAERRTLILAHGYAFWEDPETPYNWRTFTLAQEFLETYDDIIVLNYAGWFLAYRYSKNDNGDWTIQVIPMYKQITNDVSIRYIALVLAQYIIQDYKQIEDNVDFICHSMGGLVTRYMIKAFYTTLQDHFANHSRDFKIKNIAMMAPPNHGSYLNVGGDLQQREMLAGSPFLNELNAYESGMPAYSEIPYSGRNINWFTYKSGIYTNNAGLRHDGVVDVYSVHLYGATANKGWYQLKHEDLRHNEMMKTVIFNDIIKPPPIIDAIFNGGTPGIIMRIEDLTLQPNYEEPGGKTLLSITLPAEDQVDIVSSILTLYISTDIYQMTLKAGTADTYEVELPLAEGDYSFLITAELTGLDGRLYQMSGNLRIIDDDASPPVIQMTPEDTSISDEDAVGGVSVEWVISDYSGISEANVLLNGIEIRSYTNQGTITDSYLLPNEPGGYTISVWARDNDGDPEHDPPGGDWLENSNERTITIYDDDITPPNIQSPPGGDLSISDEDALGGVLVSWEISDDSGISEANVKLNGVEIRSYVDQGIITDSYLLPNEPGVYTISIWAKDGDNDSEDDWLEYSIEKSISIYDDDHNPPEIEITPGDLTISVGEAEGGILVEWEISDYSGISEAYVLLNGTQIRSYGNYGTIIDSHLLANQPGVYNFTIWAKDNDNDLEDDWLEYSTMITITIYEEEDTTPPPPGIPGYNIFLLLGILSVVIILISKKGRKYKF